MAFPDDDIMGMPRWQAYGFPSREAFVGTYGETGAGPATQPEIPAGGIPTPTQMQHAVPSSPTGQTFPAGYADDIVMGQPRWSAYGFPSREAFMAVYPEAQNFTYSPTSGVVNVVTGQPLPPGTPQNPVAVSPTGEVSYPQGPPPQAGGAANVPTPAAPPSAPAAPAAPTSAGPAPLSFVAKTLPPSGFTESNSLFSYFGPSGPGNVYSPGAGSNVGLPGNLTYTPPSPPQPIPVPTQSSGPQLAPGTTPAAPVGSVVQPTPTSGASVVGLQQGQGSLGTAPQGPMEWRYDPNGDVLVEVVISPDGKTYKTGNVNPDTSQPYSGTVRGDEVTQLPGAVWGTGGQYGPGAPGYTGPPIAAPVVGQAPEGTPLYPRTVT